MNLIKNNIEFIDLFNDVKSLFMDCLFTDELADHLAVSHIFLKP
jgi:hypothetical protein